LLSEIRVLISKSSFNWEAFDSMRSCVNVGLWFEAHTELEKLMSEKSPC